MTEELFPTVSEKIELALIREFLMNNPLGIPYKIGKDDIEKAINSLKKTVESLPQPLKILNIE